MRPLGLPPGPLEVLCLGAHADDIEIGCGGTLLTLAARGGVRVRHVVASATPERCLEAEHAARVFLGAAYAGLELLDLPDGRLPAHWLALKEALERVARTTDPDLVLAPRREDAHQDHRTLAELVTTVWRDRLVLRYEIPKWDPEPLTLSHYVPLTEETARRKVALLTEAYPSQKAREWWDDELFLGRMRSRGVEARTRYAEGFTVERAVLDLGAGS